MKKFITVLCAFVFIATAAPALAASASPKIKIVDQESTYQPGDVLSIEWSPSDVRVRDVSLVSTQKGGASYMLHSAKVNSDPVITSGSFEIELDDHFVPAGTYRVGITLEGTNTVITSSKKITVENKPSLFFGTKNGAVNSVPVELGETITLKWDASSVKKCEASSMPRNTKWEGSVKASGTKKVRVATPTTFYLTCGNGLGGVSSSLKADTGAPEYSNATLVPSTTFLQYNYKLGTTQQEAIKKEQSITLFNSSTYEPVYYKVNTKKQPAWINTGYTTAQITIPPKGVAGTGAFADPSMVTKPGTYKWDLTIEGNFSNSPLIIPVTMKVYR